MSKKNSKRKKGLLVRSYENSLIISTLDAAGARLHRAVSGSAFARGFCFADRLDEAKDKSLICRAVTSSKANHFFSKIKTAFARLVESSGIVGAYRRGINGILCSQVRDIGVFLLSFGLFSLISTLLKAFMFDYVSDATELSFICVAAMLICSLPMLFSKRSVASKLSESAAFSSLLSGLLGISPLALRTKLTPRAHSAIALALGTAAGSLSFVFQPVNILWTILLAIGAMTVLYSPESGLLLAIILLPFAPYTAVRIVAAASAVSYLLKLLRGKRNMSISATDSVVLLFAAACICAFGSGQAASLFAASLVYLLAVNLLRSSDLFEKGTNALSVGLFLPSFFAATSSVCALFGVTLTDYIPAITFFESDSVAVITLVSAPISLFALHKSKRRLTTVASLLFFISSTVNAVLSYSLPIWCGYAGILVVYGLFRLQAVKYAFRHSACRSVCGFGTVPALQKQRYASVCVHTAVFGQRICREADRRRRSAVNGQHHDRHNLRRRDIAAFILCGHRAVHSFKRLFSRLQNASRLSAAFLRQSFGFYRRACVYHGTARNLRRHTHNFSGVLRCGTPFRCG